MTESYGPCYDHQAKCFLKRPRWEASGAVFSRVMMGLSMAPNIPAGVHSTPAILEQKQMRHHVMIIIDRYQLHVSSHYADLFPAVKVAACSQLCDPRVARGPQMRTRGEFKLGKLSTIISSWVIFRPSHHRFGLHHHDFFLSFQHDSGSLLLQLNYV
jgi:hypothetical protein